MKQFFAAQFWSAWVYAAGHFAGVGPASVQAGPDFVLPRGQADFVLPAHQADHVLPRAAADFSLPES